MPPDGSLSPFPQSLDTPADAALPPVLSAPSAILADLDTGQVLFAQDADTQRPIASLTKVMTGLLVLESSNPADVVTVTADAVIAEDERPGVSALGLEVGEQITVDDLLYALLLQSANDAAVALADHVSGSEGRFVKDMNARAASLGMRRTRFRSPNGLDDRGYSTARDLMTLTRTAMAIPRFADIVATMFHSIPAPDGGTREIQNRDALLWLYAGASGVKTGYTSRAGFCIVATAEQDGRRLVSVVLGAPGDAFSDAAALLGPRVHRVHGTPIRDRRRAGGGRHAPGRERPRRDRRGPAGAGPDRLVGRRHGAGRRGPVRRVPSGAGRAGGTAQDHRSPASRWAASRCWSRPFHLLRRSKTARGGRAPPMRWCTRSAPRWTRSRAEDVRRPLRGRRGSGC